MHSRFHFQLAVTLGAIILCAAGFLAWRADRRDRAQLAAELASTKELLAAADAHQHERDTQLAQTLAALAAEKRSVVTPAQIIRELPKNIPLPAPITLQPDQASPARAGARFSLPAQASASPAPSSPQAAAGATPSSRAKPRDGPPAANASTTPTLTAEEPFVGARLASPAATASQSNQKAPPAGAFIPSADLKPLYDFTLDCQACQAKLSAAQGNLVDEKAKTAALTRERDDALRVARGGSAWRRLARAAKWFVLGAAAGAVAAKTR